MTSQRVDALVSDSGPVASHRESRTPGALGGARDRRVARAMPNVRSVRSHGAAAQDVVQYGTPARAMLVHDECVLRQASSPTVAGRQ